jgi:hypothetical protein
VKYENPITKHSRDTSMTNVKDGRTDRPKTIMSSIYRYGGGGGIKTGIAT